MLSASFVLCSECAAVCLSYCCLVEEVSAAMRAFVRLAFLLVEGSLSLHCCAVSLQGLPVLVCHLACTSDELQVGMVKDSAIC